VLTSQRRELETDGYIERKVYPIVPPKTEYSLTKKGEEILELIMIFAIMV
jgi:DNA-binding HxlR family transcriptional regulator